MRRRISRQNAAVERNARPRDALHVRHVGIVIQVRIVLGFLLDDAEDTGGRLASLLAARYRRPQDPAFGVIYSDLLVEQRNDGHDRLNRLASNARLERHRAFFPAVCRARMIARRDHSGQARNGNGRRPQPSLSVLRADEIRRHARPSGRATPAHAERIITSCAPSCQAQFRAIKSSHWTPPTYADCKHDTSHTHAEWQYTMERVSKSKKSR